MIFHAKCMGAEIDTAKEETQEFLSYDELSEKQKSAMHKAIEQRQRKFARAKK